MISRREDILRSQGILVKRVGLDFVDQLAGVAGVNEDENGPTLFYSYDLSLLSLNII
jgi:hypothetical protein